ncbi:hypothetical protein ACFQX7_23680 [Luedemannella flava]
MPGPKPASAAPTAAPARCMPRVRASSRYHPAAVAARFTATSRANETAAPKMTVTGVNSTPCRVCDALAIMLTPSGALSRSVTRLKSPVQTSVPCPRNHSMSAWSCTLAASARVCGSGHRPAVSSPATATYAAQTSASTTRGRRSAAHTRRLGAGGCSTRSAEAIVSDTVLATRAKISSARLCG